MSPFIEGAAFETGAEFAGAMAAVTTQEGLLAAKTSALGLGATALTAGAALLGVYWGVRTMMRGLKKK